MSCAGELNDVIQQADEEHRRRTLREARMGGTYTCIRKEPPLFESPEVSLGAHLWVPTSDAGGADGCRFSNPFPEVASQSRQNEVLVVRVGCTALLIPCDRLTPNEHLRSTAVGPGVGARRPALHRV